MSVIVHTRDKSITFVNGTDWYIDDSGRLHVRDDRKQHIAAFNMVDWRHATTADWSPEKEAWMRRQAAAFREE